LKHPTERLKYIEAMHSHPGIVRIAGFQSTCLALYYLKIYKYVLDSMRRLYGHHDTLVPNFKSSVYPTTSVNLGPQTVCYAHFDDGNSPNIPCTVTALGKFNHQHGGQMYWPQVGISVDFPSGSSIALPSSFLEHGNIAVAAGEKRMSVTQYCPGGLLRWVEYGFQSGKSLDATAAGRVKKLAINGPPDACWCMTLDMYSTISDLVGHGTNRCSNV
ncbi:hypothetical protein FISHEDRAFT_47407, partial [Fistulina hepatica ATCC 64428]